MIRNSIKEEMYAQTKTVGTRRMHILYEGQYLLYMHTKQKPKTNK